jgi:predicted Zn-dependent protease
MLKDAAVSLLLRQSSKHAASAWLNKAGQQVLGSGYSRDEELEADAFAASLLGTAGGDTLSGERLLDRLAQWASGQGVSIAGNYFASHPPFAERVTNLRLKRRG